MNYRSVAELFDEVNQLRGAVAEDSAARIAGWTAAIERQECVPSAENLAHYLPLRRRAVRPLQLELMVRGLSSLGRAESRVMPALDAVAGALGVLAGRTASAAEPEATFFAGEERLAARTTELLGVAAAHRPVRILVTVPSEASTNAGFMVRLAELGVEAVRINCAHDDQDAWARMIRGVDLAAEKTGRRMKVLMDLAGPKIRTGAIRKKTHPKRLSLGDLFAIARPGELERVEKSLPGAECTQGEAVAAAQVGERILLDDGVLTTVVKRVEAWGVVVEVTGCADAEGYKLRAEKGINFPDTDFSIPALTDKDREDLGFIARHADGVEFSFVQREADVIDLQQALARERPLDWQKLGLVLKIETVRAVSNLPEIIVRAGGRQPTAIMIARGDLAVEIGFARLAEMQEELLWLGEAAQVPVIWATQVLEDLVKTGMPSRGEMTDAAMSARAECVMLNKGPFVFDAIEQLDGLLSRMHANMHKKAPQMRRLASW